MKAIKPADVKPGIGEIFKQNESNFVLDEEMAQRVSGEEGVERAKELKEEFYLLRVYLLGEGKDFEEEWIEELKDHIANKLAGVHRAAALGAPGIEVGRF